MADDPQTWIDRQDRGNFVKPCIEDLEFVAVRAAREMGYSWEKISYSMSRQRQAVWKQYAPLLNESATESEPEDEPA